MKRVVYLSNLLMFLGVTLLHGAVTRKNFDFVVGVDGDFKAAKAAASKASSGKRFYIFFPNGDYNIGSLTGDANQMTTFTSSNVSFIGQSADKTVIYNKSTAEGISTTATLYLKNADNLYLQDLTILNKACYGIPSTYSTTSRHVTVCEEGDNVIYKNVKLLSTQDTYYTRGTKTYWENGEIHGTTDFICGMGDVFFYKCLLWIDKVSYIAAPDGTGSTWNYVFSNCTIDGTVSGFTLGRPWKDKAKCVYINTTMKKLPSDAGWGDPINSVSTVLMAEYNSKTSSGSSVDLTKRRTTFGSAKSNPELSASEAAKYTTDAVFGSWKPNLLTVQVSAPVVTKSGTTLNWNDNDSALCWVVFKDDKYYKCVTTPNCEMTTGTGKYTVRAANQMGGLGALSNSVDAGGTPVIGNTNFPKNNDFRINLNHSAKRIISVTVPSNFTGATLTIISSNGRIVYCKSLESGSTNLRLSNLAIGSYLFRIVANNGSEKNPTACFVQNVKLY